MIKEAIRDLVAGQTLSRQSAAGAMDEIMAGEATPAQVGGFLVALRLKGETVEEVVGLVDSMRRHATTINAPDGAVDTCGTGGDGAGTFNISTGAALVSRGAGAVVAKHGNRAASSRCGSADVLEALGVAISLPPASVEQSLRQAGICFLFAPTFHPAMKHAAGPRSELGVRTIFNVLGPLANPALVRRQAIGAPSPATAELMAEVLLALGHERALVFSSLDGLDELSPGAPADVFDVKAGKLERYRIDPQELGIAAARADDLAGADARANAALLREVLDGTPGPRRDAVVLNAAAALVAAGRAEGMGEGMQLAADAIDDGSARAALNEWVLVSQGLAGQ